MSLLGLSGDGTASSLDSGGGNARESESKYSSTSHRNIVSGGVMTGIVRGRGLALLDILLESAISLSSKSGYRRADLAQPFDADPDGNEKATGELLVDVGDGSWVIKVELPGQTQS